MEENQPTATGFRTRRASLVFCFIVMLLDIIVYASFLLSIWCVIVLIPLGFIWAIRGKEGICGIVLRILLPFVFLTAAFIYAKYNYNINRNRAETIVEACKRYGKEKGVCPVTLEKLTPDYLKSIPAAGHYFFGKKFFYRRLNDDDSGATLMWRHFVFLKMKSIHFSCVDSSSREDVVADP